MRLVILTSLLVVGLSTGAEITRDSPCFQYLGNAVNVQLEQLYGHWIQNAFAFDNSGGLVFKCSQEYYRADETDKTKASVSVPGIPDAYGYTTYFDYEYGLVKDEKNPTLLQMYNKANTPEPYYFYLILNVTENYIVAMRCPDVTNSFRALVLMTKDKPAETIKDIYDLYFKTDRQYKLGDEFALHFVDQQNCPEYDFNKVQLQPTSKPSKRDIPSELQYSRNIHNPLNFLRRP